MTFRPFDRKAAVRITRQNFPHWRQEGTTYLVTSRLADSLPKDVADDWRSKRDEWLAQHDATCVDELAEEFRLDCQRLFTDKFHDLIDAGYGECLLARRECADILIGKMIEGHGTCFQLGEWCIMPNHFHAVVEPAKGSMLGGMVQHWKGGSSFAINRMLGCSGSLRVKEPFDHIIRSERPWRRLGGMWWTV
ncbi:hypothetical protein FEM03_19470 [Phragmitibacter flavus]|uniref:Transposase IS200-like domain-containing protein n=1 Tax=Phragmitibacter flavus TaxID=2576071 RepID=A0A5R8K9R7_9BACT|nr:transposase [Phragmitibacter flavus]TLD69050.1 hypothetical protein FEM03_19470 [Phragmitibacter flavus]